MIRTMYAIGSSRARLLPAAPPHLHGWPLPWGGQRPAVFHRVRSSCDRAADRHPRAVTCGIRFALYHNTVQRAALSAGAVPISSIERVLHLERDHVAQICVSSAIAVCLRSAATLNARNKTL